MVFFFLWVAASFAVGSMAPARNRSYVDWTVLSCSSARCSRSSA
jgi:hypothetical protein